MQEIKFQVYLGNYSDTIMAFDKLFLNVFKISIVCEVCSSNYSCVKSVSLSL